jgi:acetyl esterase/lipase
MAVENLPLPKGTVALGPFCDYTTPRGSLIHNAEHDLIVNQRVLEEGLPYLETNMGGSRRDHSPVFRSFEGCPPICVVMSEHEAIYDHALLMINNARAAGVPVTVGMWKYMCHVFMMLNHFVPEGEQAMEFACNWLREQQQ